MNIDQLSTEELIAQLGSAEETFCLGEFDRFTISHDIKPGDQQVHKQWIYNLYLIENRKNPSRLSKQSFMYKLKLNFKMEGDMVFCNTSLDAFKRLLNGLGWTESKDTNAGLKRAINQFKRFISDAGIIEGDSPIRLDSFYEMYKEWALSRGKKMSFKFFNKAVLAVMKTSHTPNHIWVKVNPNFKRNFKDEQTKTTEEKQEQPKSEVEVSCPRPDVESKDSV